MLGLGSGLTTVTGYNFGFDPAACESCGGQCCAGESGYIWISPLEIDALAQSFGIENMQFVQDFCLFAKGRVSLKEKPYLDGFACIFFDETKKQCGIYELRPKQCRSFPFWEHFKTNQEEVTAECSGITKLL